MIDVIALALAAGGASYTATKSSMLRRFSFTQPALNRFAALVQQATAEECAEQIKGMGHPDEGDYGEGYAQAVRDVYYAIRTLAKAKEGTKDD